MAEQGISELFLAMVEWMKRIGVENAALGPQPWRGELKTDRDTLKSALNASKEPVDCGGSPLQPYHAQIVAEKFICVAIISPYGGAIGGWQEPDLIEIFNNAAQPGGGLRSVYGYEEKIHGWPSWRRLGCLGTDADTAVGCQVPERRDRRSDRPHP